MVPISDEKCPSIFSLRHLFLSVSELMKNPLCLLPSLLLLAGLWLLTSPASASGTSLEAPCCYICQNLLSSHPPPFCGLTPAQASLPRASPLRVPFSRHCWSPGCQESSLVLVLPPCCLCLMRLISLRAHPPPPCSSPPSLPPHLSPISLAVQPLGWQ